MAVHRLVESGELIRLARGVYMHSEAEFGEHHSLAEAAARVPQGVVCLLSALSFHGLSDELPFEVWLAYERGRSRPQVEGLPLRLVALSPEQFHQGVQTHPIEGVEVRITSPARTVADCFKFRHKIGLDVCLAALKDCLRHKAGTPGEIMEMATACRVANVMRPYVEAMQ